MDRGGRCGRVCDAGAVVVMAAGVVVAVVAVVARLPGCTASAVVTLGNFAFSSCVPDAGVAAPSLPAWLLMGIDIPSPPGWPLMGVETVLAGKVATLLLVAAVLTDGGRSAVEADAAWLVTPACADCDEATDVAVLTLATTAGAPALTDAVTLVAFAPLAVAAKV